MSSLSVRLAVSCNASCNDDSSILQANILDLYISVPCNEVSNQLLEFVRPGNVSKKSMSIFANKLTFQRELCIALVNTSRHETSRHAPQWPASNVSNSILGKNCFAMGMLRLLIYLRHTSIQLSVS